MSKLSRQTCVVRTLDRRTFLVSAAATSLVSALLHDFARAEAPGPTAPSAPIAPAAPGPAAHSAAFEEHLAKVLKSATPVAEGLVLELPEVAENGNVVPYRMQVASPMTDTDYIRALHLLSTANPQPHVATFHLIPASGKAAVAGRMRLARTQDVVAVAERSDGAFLIATRKIEVTIGGCGNE